ncbi:MAG: hypothetical protein GY808_09035 [Gammaproteobacteria bacterium]|nr:hypothetical protein [Gammaproteobacteria bacterium]
MSSKSNAFIWTVLAVVLLTVTLLYVKDNLTIESNILKLLPITENDPITEEAFSKFSDNNMQQLLFLVKNPELNIAKNAASELANSLRNSPYIEDVVLNMSPEIQQKIGLFNFAFRHHLLTSDDKKKLHNKNFDDFTDTVIQQLYSPFSGTLIQLAQQDPFLLSYRYSMATGTSAFKNISMEEGYLVVESDSNKYILVTAKLSHSSFNPEVQEQLIGAISELETGWKEQQSGNQLIRTGALFFGNFAYQSAHAEVSTIGLGSFILVIALLIVAFQSIRSIFLVSLALAFGVASGFIVVHLLFGKVHLITMVFGASLIGVAVDYAFHYLSTADSESGAVRLRRILPAITLGLTSSVIGYMALLTTPFPGLQQMAMFCITGLTAAYLTVVLLFPIIPVNNKTPIFVLVGCQLLLNFGRKKFARYIWMIALLLPLVGIFIYTTQQLGDDDIRQLQPKNTVLQGQAETIQTALSSPAANQFFLVKAVNEEQLLIKLEDTAIKLDKLVDYGIIDSYLSITQWLPSRLTQQQNFDLYKNLYQSGALEKLANYGLINNSDLSKFYSIFDKDKNNYLTVEAWVKSVTGKQFSTLWLGKFEDQFAAVIAIKGIQKLSALESFDEDTIFVDKVSKVSKLFQTYRENTSGLLLLAILFIFIILWLRYNYKKAFLITSSPLISISVAMIGITIIGEQINLFNTLAMFLVIGISIDYGLFFAETEKANARIILAIVLSALTTLFSFGLLSLSDTSAIHSFGLTMLLGISSTFLLSPIIGHLLTSEKVNKE